MRRKLIIGFLIFLLGGISTLLLSSIAPDEALGQGIVLVCGLVIFALVQYPLPRFFEKILPQAVVVTILLLFVTLLVGRVSHGATRWLPVGPFHIQVSEFAKPLLALTLAGLVIKFPLNSQKRIWGFFLVALLFIVPVFLQPDLGSSLVLGVIAITILFLTVKRIRLLFPWIVVGLTTAWLSWNLVLYPYQKDRLAAYFTGVGGASYNADQAYITVGSGKFLGRGLGHGVQSALKFLPEFHTDFFFASLAEELGALGVFLVLTLYLLLFWQTVKVPKHASTWSRIAGIGLVSSLFFQMAVHMGMNMKLFPITGIPLPLLSSGGSSLLSICLGLGLIVRLADGRDEALLKKSV